MSLWFAMMSEMYQLTGVDVMRFVRAIPMWQSHKESNAHRSSLNYRNRAFLLRFVGIIRSVNILNGQSLANKYLKIKRDSGRCVLWQGFVENVKQSKTNKFELQST